jgi:hypothetical protein
VAWQEKALPDLPASPSNRHFLLLPDATGMAEKLAARIRSAGCSYSIVYEASDLESAAADCGASSLTIVDLRFVGVSDTTSSRRTCVAVAKAVRNLATIEHAESRYWLVTRGAIATGQDAGPILPWQAPAWRTVNFGEGSSISILPKTPLQIASSCGRTWLPAMAKIKPRFAEVAASSPVWNGRFCQRPRPFPSGRMEPTWLLEDLEAWGRKSPAGWLHSARAV